MKLFNQKLLWILSGAVVTALALAGVVVYANPSYFSTTAQTATATSTGSYMTGGTGTTTVVYDANTAGSEYKADQASLIFFLTGSSTATVLNIDLEYSPGAAGVDCVATPLLCDWYKDTMFDPNSRSTTTAIANLTTTNTYALTFASTTYGGAALKTGTTTNTRILTIPTPLRYVRAILSLAFNATNANGTVWAQIVPIKQLHE